MAEIALTIDGKEVKGEEGDTILRVCQRNGIDVPTLCHFEGLTDIGSCRMCIVEIEKPGRPRIETACTTSAVGGMVVRTNTEELNSMRKAILELLFSEGNHYCPYCVASGDCELQDLAYRFGIDHLRWPSMFIKRDVDSSHEYLIMEPNRCILCRRCVRACAELVGNHTLEVGGRGTETRIIADLKLPWGESSCVKAGACLQVCPTGAISDRRSAYMGREAQVERIKSTCVFCSVGCGTELVVRDNHVLRIDGDWNAEPNRGMLCSMGRFEPLYIRTHRRALKPMIRRNGKLEEAGWDDALDLASKKLKGFDKRVIGAVTSTRATNEALNLFVSLFKTMGVDNIGCLEGPIVKPLEEKGSLAELDNADMFIVAGEDLGKGHQVVGFFVKRGIVNRRARLIIVGDGETNFTSWAYRRFKPDEVEQAIRLCDASARPAVIYGAGAGKELETLHRELSGKAGFFWMAPGTNSRGALTAGIDRAFDTKTARCVYVLACDECKVSEELLSQLEDADFVVVQGSYIDPWSKVADVILPTAIWAEKEGSITNLEGRTLSVTKAIEPPAGVKGEVEILRLLSQSV